ncbi:MAG: RND transporter [Desulfuromonas sp.]|uniref:efflux RND transporter permease subunit n=1 Tax=Desulfuromonas sp. TaxID=892 RepID=UPI000CAED606|nr:MMPL family transporter [Desulfuromonas sp.]PLX84951.1 MAG: RND transporter [Desulfuromonas sp.]
MIERFTRSIIHRRFLTLLLALGVFAGLSAGVRLLEFTTDYRVFFSEDNPQLAAFESLQKTFTKVDNILFVLHPADGGVLTPQTLAALKSLTEAAWQIPHSTRVDSLTNFQHSFSQGDELVVEDLVRDPASLSSRELARVKKISLNDPRLVNQLISPEADVAGVNVTVQLPGRDPRSEVQEAVFRARELAQQVRHDNPGMDVHLTGYLMMNRAFWEASQHDLRTLVPIMFAAVAALLALLLRSWAGVFASALVVTLSISGAMGLAGWAGVKLTPASVMAPTIILTLAVANCVHILVGFFQGLRQGLARAESMTESLQVNLAPVFLTSLTTTIGFLSMNFSDTPPFRDLGNIVALGVALAFILGMTLLPALMMILPLAPPRAQAREGGAINVLGRSVVRHRSSLLWGSAAVMLLLASFIPRNELNDAFIEYFDQSIEFRRSTDYSNEHLTGIYTVEYALDAGEPGGISDPAFLAVLDRFAQWYRQQPEAVHVNSITDTMKRLNQNLHDDDPLWHRLPDKRDLAAQYLLLYEMSLPYGLDLNDRINVDKSATRLTVTLHHITSRQMLALEERARTWLRANAPVSMQVEGTGPAVMFFHLTARNVASMLPGWLGALALISLIMVAALRSVKLGLLSILPNLVPAAMAFGVWGLLVSQVGISVSMVAGMTLGVVVDDTIHFMTKYQRARRVLGKSPQEATLYAFSSVAAAMIVTTLVLLGGFLVLSLSAYEMNAAMGQMAAITIGLALATDLLFLPALLMKTEEKSHAKSSDLDAAEPASL